MSFNLSDYETVADRVKRFIVAFPEGKILTEIVSHDPVKGEILAKAFIFRKAEDTLATASDYAFGIASTYPQSMRKFYVEDTVTSAIGRALSLILETGSKPTREDMEKVKAHEEIKNQIQETRAKMSQTGSTYVPVAKEDDPWSTWDAAPVTPVDDAVALVQQRMGAEAIKTVPNCKCGKPMKWGDGNKNGRLWGNYKCSIWNKTTGAGCDAIEWYEVGKDGTWVPQKKW